MLSALWQPLAATPVLIGWIWKQKGFKRWQYGSSMVFLIANAPVEIWERIHPSGIVYRAVSPLTSPGRKPSIQTWMVDALQWHKAIQSPKFGHVYTSTPSKPMKNHSKAGIMWWLPVANMDYDQNHQISWWTDLCFEENVNEKCKVLVGFS